MNVRGFVGSYRGKWLSQNSRVRIAGIGRALIPPGIGYLTICGSIASRISTPRHLMPRRNCCNIVVQSKIRQTVRITSGQSDSPTITHDHTARGGLRDAVSPPFVVHTSSSSHTVKPARRLLEVAPQLRIWRAPAPAYLSRAFYPLGFIICNDMPHACLFETLGMCARAPSGATCRQLISPSAWSSRRLAVKP